MSEQTVPHEVDPTGSGARYTVVVGAGTSTRSDPALRWAAEEASVHGGRLVVVRAWRPTPPSTSGTRPPLQTYDPDEDLSGREAQLRSDVRRVLGESASVEHRLVHGGRRGALLDVAAEGADLLVVGASRRRRRPERLGLAHRLLSGADCPVVVVPLREA